MAKRVMLAAARPCSRSCEQLPLATLNQELSSQLRGLLLAGASLASQLRDLSSAAAPTLCKSPAQRPNARRCGPRPSQLRACLPAPTEFSHNHNSFDFGCSPVLLTRLRSDFPPSHYEKF